MKSAPDIENQAQGRWIVSAGEGRLGMTGYSAPANSSLSGLAISYREFNGVCQE
jgi:hypothetical protein